MKKLEICKHGIIKKICARCNPSEPPVRSSEIVVRRRRAQVMWTRVYVCGCENTVYKSEKPPRECKQHNGGMLERVIKTTEYR